MAKTTAVGKILAGNKMSMLGFGVEAFFAISDYKQQRLEGKGKVGAALSAAGSALMFEAMGPIAGMAVSLLPQAPSMAMNAYLKANEVARSMDRASRNSAFNNATFADSQQAYTMRQAGMQMAQASKYNLQQTLLGNEASVMHRL